MSANMLPAPHPLVPTVLVSPPCTFLQPLPSPRTCAPSCTPAVPPVTPRWVRLASSNHLLLSLARRLTAAERLGRASSSSSSATTVIGRPACAARGSKEQCRPRCHSSFPHPPLRTAHRPLRCRPLPACPPAPTTAAHHRCRHARPAPALLASLLQGVELTHANLLATIVSMKAFVAAHDVRLTEEDVYLSFLPLAHIFDRRVPPSPSCCPLLAAHSWLPTAVRPALLPRPAPRPLWLVGSAGRAHHAQHGTVHHCIHEGVSRRSVGGPPVSGAR